MVRAASRWLLALIYLAAGVVHLAAPDVFLKVMPDWVMLPREMVLVTGICEIAGALGLVKRRFRWWAGMLLALYAVCVFPANIKHAMIDLESGTGLSIWYHGPRLLAQPLIVLWALWVGEVWPGRSRPATPRSDQA
ncbi:DoxX family protein [Sphingomonas sp. LT1P40]|uniref:DoxX family protein n=1 Tax=Alteristakelama amylovorans TaxID=3096166 RepID=UPI002FC8130B